MRQANWRRGKGESPLERRMSRSTIHREPCSGTREGAGEASVAVRVGRVLSVENDMVRSAEAFLMVEGNIGCAAMARRSRTSRRLRPQARTYTPRRDLGGLRVVLAGNRWDRVGKADSRSR